MMIGFIIWSIVAVIFLGIGVNCRKSSEPVGFFTFEKTPKVKNVKEYNDALSMLWFAAAGALEVIGIPLLFIKQNSPLFIPIILGVVILVIAMMIAYMKIEEKYKN